MSKGIFITGTGTDVGKTYISGLLVKALKEADIHVGYFKAAVSGNEFVDGKLIPGDALHVKKTANLTQRLEDMVPFVYEHAYSPHLASSIEGNPVTLDTLKACFDKCEKEHEFVLAEGSGGILCPIRFDEEEIWLEDIIRLTGFDTVIVADAGLGTINNTVLTAYYMKQKSLPIKGIIYNHFEEGNVMHLDNIKMIEHLTKLPTLAKVKNKDLNINIDLKNLL